MKKKGWRVKGTRPEEEFLSPENFYSKEEIERYSKCNSMKKTQQKIALRLIELMEITPGKKVLDVGCGTGNSMELFEEKGFKVTGLELVKGMAETARKKGFKVVQGDMRCLEELFEKESFEAVISISALQWISKSSQDLRKFCFGAKEVLCRKGLLGIQFYPQSESEASKAEKVIGKYFNSRLTVDNPENAKKRTVYITGKKSQ